jgi:hypothetical protein
MAAAGHGCDTGGFGRSQSVEGPGKPRKSRGVGTFGRGQCAKGSGSSAKLAVSAASMTEEQPLGFESAP